MQDPGSSSGSSCDKPAPVAPRQSVYVRSCVLGFGAAAREALECCHQQNLTAILVGDWKSRIMREMQIAEPMRFQRPKGTQQPFILHSGKESGCVLKNLSNTELKSKKSKLFGGGNVKTM